MKHHCWFFYKKPLLEYKMSTTLCPLSETVMNSSGTWSLADRSNTTTLDSARALDFSTQYQPSVVYERNLQDMYNNAVSELKDLQFKARERAPYNTNLCTLKPMYPTWNAAQPCLPPACETNLKPTCFGNSPCNPPSTFYAGTNYQAPVCPGYPPNPNLLIPGALNGWAEQAADIARANSNARGLGEGGDDESDTSEAEEEVAVLDQDTSDMQNINLGNPYQVKPLKRISKNMMRALLGVAYDLNHWKDLPPQKSRLSTTKTLKFVVGRDNRPLYIVMLVAFFVFIVAIMVGIGCLSKKAHHKHKRNKVLKELKERAYLQYQLQNMSKLANPQSKYSQMVANLAGGVRRW